MEVPRPQMGTVHARHHVLHQLQQPLEIAQQVTLRRTETLGILADLLHLLERPFPVALVDGRAQRRCAAEVSVSQQFDLANTQSLTRHRLHEAFDLCLADAVHAHERPQRDHVRIDGKRAAEE